MKKIFFIFSASVIFFGLYLTSLHSYLLFHSLAEIFSIMVAFGIFMTAWNSGRFLKNNYLIFLGIAYLFVGGIDLLHTLAYKGMNIFYGYDANLPTQLWISARYVESISLLIAPLFFGRKPRSGIFFLSYTIVISMLMGAIFYWQVFPDCFVEGAGLTVFKKISEYVISTILVLAIFSLIHKRKEIDDTILKLLIASIMITIGSELAFTFYINVYGISNLIGHMFKIISFYLIYKAIIETGFIKPYSLLFRDLKTSEEALKKSKELFHKTFENQTDAILILDGKIPPQIMDCNQAATQMFGYRRQELLGNTTECLHVDSKTMKDFQIKLYPTIEKQGYFHFNDFQMKRKGEIVFATEHSITPLMNENNERIGWVSVIRDISERKRAEDEKKNLEAQLQQAKKMEAIATLAGGIAHQFNNALSAITINLDLLELDSKNDQKTANNTQTMRGSAYHMAHLTSQLLAYAQGGKYKIQTISISEFIKRTLSLIKHTMSPDIEVIVDLPEDIIPVKVDLAQMQMVLSAIMQNASEAIEGKGCIRITTQNRLIDAKTAENHHGMKPGSYVSLIIRDDGKGMDLQTKNRIFEPFFTTKFYGRGLGMAAVYGIVKSHDGWISIDSKEGEGTCVTIYFPIVDEKIQNMNESRAEGIQSRSMEYH